MTINKTLSQICPLLNSYSKNMEDTTKRGNQQNKTKNSHTWNRFSRKQEIQCPGQGDPKNLRNSFHNLPHYRPAERWPSYQSSSNPSPLQFMQGNCREPGKNSFIDCCNLAETNSSADSLCHNTEVTCFSAEFKLGKP